jgi:hypothetical protein
VEHTKTWGLPFPFLITHILRKKGIKGNVADGLITESPHFGQIQWNQSCSHMPRVVRDPEMMDVDEPVVPEPTVPETQALEPAVPETLAPKPAVLETLAPEPVESQVEPEEEEEEEHEETITLRATDFYALQDTLEDIRFQIADI